MKLRACTHPLQTNTQHKGNSILVSLKHVQPEGAQKVSSILSHVLGAFVGLPTCRPAACTTHRNLYLWGVFCFVEEGHEATQGGLKLAIWSRLTLNCSSSCLCLPGIGITGVCHHAHLSVVCVVVFLMPPLPSSLLSSH